VKVESAGRNIGRTVSGLLAGIMQDDWLAAANVPFFFLSLILLLFFAASLLFLPDSLAIISVTSPILASWLKLDRPGIGKARLHSAIPKGCQIVAGG
jgi:hypothetical protein